VIRGVRYVLSAVVVAIFFFGTFNPKPIPSPVSKPFEVLFSISPQDGRHHASVYLYVSYYDIQFNQITAAEEEIC